MGHFKMKKIFKKVNVEERLKRITIILADVFGYIKHIEEDET